MGHEHGHGGHGHGPGEAGWGPWPPWAQEGMKRGWARAFRSEMARGGWGPPGRRARRGAIRRMVLSGLAEGPAHGYDVIQRLEARSGGLWRPSPGSVYPLLQLLEDQGLVASHEEEGKRRYHLTEAGRAEADVGQGAQRFPWDADDEAGEQVQQLRDAVVQVHIAARQVARTGQPAQIGRSIEIVRAARKSLYEILAQD